MIPFLSTSPLPLAREPEDMLSSMEYFFVFLAIMAILHMVFVVIVCVVFTHVLFVMFVDPVATENGVRHSMVFVYLGVFQTE